jgi:hypothetical protein
MMPHNGACMASDSQSGGLGFSSLIDASRHSRVQLNIDRASRGSLQRSEPSSTELELSHELQG